MADEAEARWVNNNLDGVGLTFERRFASPKPLAFAPEHDPDILRIVGADGHLLVRLSTEQPSFVDTERLGDAAQLFLDEVVRLASGMGLDLVPAELGR